MPVPPGTTTVRYHCGMNDSASPSATPDQWLHLYATHPHACNYLPDREACMQLVHPPEKAATPVYAQLIEQGFRRSGLITYRPRCPACASCLPLRVLVNHFQPNRSQRRAIKQHGALQVRLLPLAFHPEHYALYQQYQQQRHNGSAAGHDGEQEYRDFILSSHVDSFLAEFRNAAGVLKIVAVIDRLPQALSAVYTFYAHEPAASYGTYAILWQIAQARCWHLPYLHLGYWIADSAKMQYKSNFRPCQVLRDRGWHMIETICR